MRIRLNNEPKEIAHDLSLESFLRELKLSEKKGIAVAVNETVVAKKNQPGFVLKENDSVLVIQAAQGG